MHLTFAKRHPTAGFRLTALLAALTILALAVLSASPALHAWVHDNAAQAASSGHPSGTGGHGGTGGPGHDDSLCAISVFAQGVVAYAFFAFVLAFLRLSQAGVRPVAERPAVASPRYRLPPHCGPPLD